MKSDEYIAKQKILQLQMLQADYPNIHDEKTNVRLAVNGATNHPHFRSVASVLRVAGLTTSLGDLK